jgi:SAM-dependent methyltransferase
MPGSPVNYDRIAPAYDQRYAINPLAGVAAALASLARERGAERLLEVGCGTGRWLAELGPGARRVYGLDRSPGMLRQARERNASFHLICGRAGRLPFTDAAFDLVFCVNALHHFDHPRDFISEARRVLRPGGALAVVGMDPHGGQDRWYLYDYFEGTRAADLARFPSRRAIMDWMAAAGFVGVDWQQVERIRDRRVGREVLTDHFLQKHGTSQLALLPDEAYAAGLRRIETALVEAEAREETLVFEADIALFMVAGRARPFSG